MNWSDAAVYRDGKLYWKDVKPGHHCRPAGEEIGCLDPVKNRWYVKYKGVRCQRSRVVWEMHFGPIPKGMCVDHINRIRSDDRIENLRLATYRQNSYNAKLRSDSRGRYKGVRFRGKPPTYTSSLTYKRKNIYLGDFKEEADAAQMYNFQIKKYAGEYAALNDSGIYEEWFKEDTYDN